MLRSRFARLLAGALLIFGTSAVAAAPSAHANVVDLTCTVTGVVTYDPPITFIPQPSTSPATGVYSNCEDTSGQSPAVITGSFRITVSGNLGCLTAASATGSGAITWTLADG